MTPTLPLSIRTSTDISGVLSIEIVDQLLLPHTVTYVPIPTIASAHAAIKNMQIRGAPAIASLASLSIASELSRALVHSASEDLKYAYLGSPEELKAFVEPQLDFLYTSRPTAVNLGAAIRRLQRVLDVGVASGSAEDDKRQAARILAEKLFREAKAIADEDFGRNKEMSAHGTSWLAEQVQHATGAPASKLNVLTVCNTGSLATSVSYVNSILSNGVVDCVACIKGYGTALGLITHLFETGRLGTAYFTQTAPYHQGSRFKCPTFSVSGISYPRHDSG